MLASDAASGAGSWNAITSSRLPNWVVRAWRIYRPSVSIAIMKRRRLRMECLWAQGNGPSLSTGIAAVPFDLVGHLFRTGQTGQQVIQVNGSSSNVTMEIHTSALTDIGNVIVLPIRVLNDGKPIKAADTVTGEIGEDAIIRLNGILYETDLFRGYTTGASFGGSTFRTPTNGYHSNQDGEGYLIESDRSQALQTIDALIAAAGLNITGFVATRADDDTTDASNTIPASPILTPRGYLGFPTNGTLDYYFDRSVGGKGQRRVPILEMQNRPWTRYPWASQRNRVFDAELLLDIEIPKGITLLPIKTPTMQTGPDKGTPVDLLTSDPDVSRGDPLWYSTESYNVTETVEGDGQASRVVQIYDLSITVAADTQHGYDTYDIFVDADRNVWNILGIERIDRKINRFACQRTI